MLVPCFVCGQDGRVGREAVVVRVGDGGGAAQMELFVDDFGFHAGGQQEGGIAEDNACDSDMGAEAPELGLALRLIGLEIIAQLDWAVALKDFKARGVNAVAGKGLGEYAGTLVGVGGKIGGGGNVEPEGAVAGVFYEEAMAALGIWLE